MGWVFIKAVFHPPAPWDKALDSSSFSFVLFCFSVPQLCVFESSPILILPWVVPCNLREEKRNINFPFLPGRLGVLNRCFFKWGFECIIQQRHASEAKTHLVSAQCHQTSGANSEMCLAQLHPSLWSFLIMFSFFSYFCQFYLFVFTFKKLEQVSSVLSWLMMKSCKFFEPTWSLSWSSSWSQCRLEQHSLID